MTPQDYAIQEYPEAGVLDWQNLYSFSEHLFNRLKDRAFLHLEARFSNPGKEGLWLPAAQPDAIEAIFWIECEDKPQQLLVEQVGLPVFVISRTYTARVIVETTFGQVEIPLGAGYRLSQDGVQLELRDDQIMRLVFLELINH